MAYKCSLPYTTHQTTPYNCWFASTQIVLGRRITPTPGTLSSYLYNKATLGTKLRPPATRGSSDTFPANCGRIETIAKKTNDGSVAFQGEKDAKYLAREFNLGNVADVPPDVGALEGLLANHGPLWAEFYYLNTNTADYGGHVNVVFAADSNGMVGIFNPWPIVGVQWITFDEFSWHLNPRENANWHHDYSMLYRA